MSGCVCDSTEVMMDADSAIDLTSFLFAEEEFQFE